MGNAIYKDGIMFAGAAESPVTLIEDDRERQVGWKMTDSTNRLYKPLYKMRIYGTTPSAVSASVTCNLPSGSENHEYVSGQIINNSGYWTLLPQISRDSATNQMTLVQISVNTFGVYAGSTTSPTILNRPFWADFKYTKTTDVAVPLSQVPGGGMAGGDMSRAYYDQTGEVVNAGGIKSFIGTNEKIPVTFRSGYSSAGSAYDGTIYYPALKLCVFTMIITGNFPVGALTEVGVITNTRHYPVASVHTSAATDGTASGQFIAYNNGSLQFLPPSAGISQCRASFVYYARG